METINESVINQNMVMYIEKLKKYNCYSEKMINELCEIIKVAPYNKDLNNGAAYKGSLIDVTLNVLCVIGYQMNNLVFMHELKNGTVSHPELAVNNDMLMRVLLLCDIGKCQMFVPQTEEWLIKKGEIYKFSNNLTSLKVGERSLYLCQKYEIILNELEYDSIKNIDNKDGINFTYQNPLSYILNIARQLTSLKLKQRYAAYVEKSKK